MKRKRHPLMFIALVFSMLLGIVTAMMPNQYVNAAEEKQGTIYLSDLEWESATKGSKDNEIQKDLNFGNEEIKLMIAGVETSFEKGIGTHAASDIVYNIKGKGYTKFEAWAGVDRHALTVYENSKNNTEFEEGIIDRFSVLIDGREVAASGELNPTSDAHHFEIEIPENAERITLHCAEGSQNWSDWADWADAKFYQEYPESSNAADYILAQYGEDGESETIRTEYLSDREWVEQSCGAQANYPNGTTKDTNIDGGVLTLLVDGGETEFDKGLGIHAPSSVMYNIEGEGYKTFQAYAGVDYSKFNDYKNGEAQIGDFIVKIDNQVVAQSGPMNPSMNAYYFNVTIPDDAKTITLETTIGEANDWADWGNWADAKLTTKERDPVPATDIELTVPRVSYQEGTTIKAGRKAVLKAKITPGDSTDTIASYESDNEEIAVVDENGVVTGVAEGTAVITAATTNGITGTIEINVLPKQEAGKLRHEINAENPLYLENYYWSDDFADKNGVSGNVPQEERADSPAVLWETVPDSLKDNTVILLIAERSLNNTDEIRQWIKDNVELCNENGIPCAVQAVNGETNMADPISIEFYEELAKNNEMLVGYNGAELYNEFNGSAGEYMVDLIQMCIENGLYMMWTDTNIFGEDGVLVDWLQDIPELSAVMRENKEHIVMMYKESYGQPNTDALYLGMWLTEYCDNWGIASDWWHWQLDGNGALFEGTNDGDAWKQCLTWPEAMYTQDILRAVSQGATCFKSEAQWYSNATQGMRTPGYQYSIIPFLEKLANGEYKIPSKAEVAERTKAIVVGRGNWHEFNYDTTLSQLYPSTAKYGIVPFVPENCPEEALEGFDLVIRENLGSGGLKVALDEIYTTDKTGGTAWTENFGDTYYFMNSSEDKDVTQNSIITPKINSSESLEITAGPHTYGVIKENEDTLSLSLGNYRIDKTELWTDPKYAGGFGDMDCYEYVWEMCERMKTDTNHDKDLRTTTVKVVCAERPTITFAEDNEYTRPYEYEEAWDEAAGTYTLTLKHNGIVDVEIRTTGESGNEPGGEEKPEGGDKPGGEDKPDGDKPEENDKPDGDKPEENDKPNKGDKPEKDDAVQTGDTSPILLWGIAAVAAGGAVVVAKRKKNR